MNRKGKKSVRSNLIVASLTAKLFLDYLRWLLLNLGWLRNTFD